MDIPVLIACQRHSKKDRLTASPSCQSKNWPREKTSACQTAPKWSEHAKYLHHAWSSSVPRHAAVELREGQSEAEADARTIPLFFLSDSTFLETFAPGSPGKTVTLPLLNF